MKFDFDQINLIPKKCIVNSRSECDTSVVLGKHTFKLPIVPANMECVINQDLALKLAEQNYFYVMHRFNIDQVKFIEMMNQKNLISSISIGVNSDSYELIDELVENSLCPDYITIDIAHGHSIKMEQMLKYVKGKLPDTFVIAGNISTIQAVNELTEWGADALKVGIGPGSACTTFPTTGFGSRNCQASVVYECAQVSDVPIIADGGIKSPADISKSIVLGATFVMVGGMLSGFRDSPGITIELNGRNYKEFWGSASAHQSGKSSRIEGKKNLVDYKDKTLLEEYNYITECLQSSISYGGGNKLSDLDNVNWF
jgi:GMP reductase